jgi:hypothetical protein
MHLYLRAVELSLTFVEWRLVVRPLPVTPVVHWAGWRAAVGLPIAQVQESILVTVVVGAAELDSGLELAGYHRSGPW